MKARLENPASQAERLATYLDRLSRVAGHADRIAPMQSYTKGLFLPIERKSVEPMAARLAPASVRQMHQSLHSSGLVVFPAGLRRGRAIAGAASTGGAVLTPSL